MCPPPCRGGGVAAALAVSGGRRSAVIAVIAAIAVIAIAVVAVLAIMSCHVEGFLQSSTHLVAHQLAAIWGLSRSPDA